MSYEVLERQIKALPETAQQEVAHYVGYLFSIYNKKQASSDVKERINSFLKENPNAFDELAPVRNCGLESIRELTKNDEW